MKENLIKLNDILVDPSFKEALISSGLSTEADIMVFSGGELFTYRGKKERSVVRRLLSDGRPVYLKRHYVASEGCILSRAIRSRRSSGALRERAGIELFRKRGLPTTRLVAVGKSFIITEEIKGSVRLEDYIAEHFGFPLEKKAMALKRRISRDLAFLTRRMHQAALSHKDYYLGHIFIRPSDLSLYVLDLQRVDCRLKWGGRWAVKDIAALDFSALPQYVSSADRMRFFKVYWGKERLDGEAKSFIRRVLRKSNRIALHTEKLLARRRKADA